MRSAIFPQRTAGWLLAWSAAVPVAFAAEPTLPLETAVKRLTSVAAAPPAMDGRTPPMRVATPTTPGGKLPQYQLGHQQRRMLTEAELANSQIRFLLALPQAVLLIEATITIDGHPYQQVREQRVEQILKDLTVAAESEAVSAVADSAGRLQDRLRQIQKTSGETPSKDEVRWLLTNWVDGPTLLQLNDNFQRFRGHQRPEFHVLDRNRDGAVSPDELQQAVSAFQECDRNRDDIIQFTEIAAAAADSHRASLPEAPPKLLTLLSQPLSSSAQVPQRFDRNNNGRFDADEWEAAVPDLRLSVAFDAANSNASRLAITAVAAEFAASVPRATIDPTSMALHLGGTVVLFSAVQQEASDQVSVGAVIDGYPLLPALDPNDDGRLTLRELRGLSDRLRAFDRNQDGALTTAETPAPIRVCFGLGPLVHRELAGIRSVHRRESTTPQAGPEWFVRMDRNKDHDLTRGEFPGTDEQFASLDADADGLVGAAEALAYDQKTNTPADPPAVDATTEPR